MLGVIKGAKVIDKLIRNRAISGIKNDIYPGTKTYYE